MSEQRVIFEADELFQMAFWASLQNRVDDALGYLKEAATRDKDNPGIHLALASEYAKLDLIQRALDSYDRVIELDQKQYLAYLKKSALLHSVGLNDESKKCLEVLLSLGEDSYYFWFGKGFECLIDINDADALDAFRRGISLSNNIDLNTEISQIVESLESNLDGQVFLEDPTPLVEEKADAKEHADDALDAYKLS